MWNKVGKYWVKESEKNCRQIRKKYRVFIQLPPPPPHPPPKKILKTCPPKFALNVPTDFYVNHNIFALLGCQSPLCSEWISSPHFPKFLPASGGQTLNRTMFQLTLPVDSQNVSKKSDGSQDARRVEFTAGTIAFRICMVCCTKTRRISTRELDKGLEWKNKTIRIARP